MIVDGQSVQTATGEVQIALNQTPFYAESGGQVGDAGTLRTETGEARITDTRKVAGVFLHIGTISSGDVRTGQGAELVVDADRRALLETFATPTDRPDPASLDKAIEEVKEGIAAAIDADAMTARYASYMGGMMDDIAHITYTPPLAGMAVEAIDPQTTDPPSPRMGLAKQLYLKVAAFSGRTARVLKELRDMEIERKDVVDTIAIYTFIYTTPLGAKFLAAIERMSAMMWALF